MFIFKFMVIQPNSPTMASNTTNLQQLLQHKQEPFKLKIYLLERRYSTNEPNYKKFTLDDASKFLTIKVNKRRKIVSTISKTLKTLANKLLYVKSMHTKSEQRINGGKFNWSCMETKHQHHQLSPISVLEDAHSDQTSHVCNVEKDHLNVSIKKPNTLFSLEDLLSNELCDSKISSNYLKNKTQLQKTPQWLLGCIMEVIQTYKLKNTRKQHQYSIGSKEIKRILNENVFKWSKQSTKDENDFYLLASFEDWKYDSREEMEHVAKVIGDSILDDIVISEYAHQVICKPQCL